MRRTKQTRQRTTLLSLTHGVTCQLLEPEKSPADAGLFSNGLFSLSELAEPVFHLLAGCFATAIALSSRSGAQKSLAPCVFRR